MRPFPFDICMQLHVPPCRGAARERGFTLIELMIVVAVAAILATVAMPAYTRMINKSRAKDAAADLASLGLNLENRFQLQLSYPVNAAGTVVGTSANNTFTGWAATQSSYFDYSLLSNAASYTLTATGKGRLKDCIVTLTGGTSNDRTASSACGFTTW
jgi:type IV pilus assembly protein PilE